MNSKYYVHAINLYQIGINLHDDDVLTLANLNVLNVSRYMVNDMIENLHFFYAKIKCRKSEYQDPTDNYLFQNK